MGCQGDGSVTAELLSRFAVFVDVDNNGVVTVTCCSPFVHALSNEAGAGQFMIDFLPLTARSQVPPVSK